MTDYHHPFPLKMHFLLLLSLTQATLPNSMGFAHLDRKGLSIAKYHKTVNELKEFPSGLKLYTNLPANTKFPWEHNLIARPASNVPIEQSSKTNFKNLVPNLIENRNTPTELGRTAKARNEVPNSQIIHKAIADNINSNNVGVAAVPERNQVIQKTISDIEDDVATVPERNQVIQKTISDIEDDVATVPERNQDIQKTISEVEDDAPTVPERNQVIQKTISDIDDDAPTVPERNQMLQDSISDIGDPEVIIMKGDHVPVFDNHAPIPAVIHVPVISNKEPNVILDFDGIKPSAHANLKKEGTNKPESAKDVGIKKTARDYGGSEFEDVYLGSLKERNSRVVKFESPEKKGKFRSRWFSRSKSRPKKSIPQSEERKAVEQPGSNALSGPEMDDWEVV
jgi:archaellum component FlaC